MTALARKMERIGGCNKMPVTNPIAGIAVRRTKPPALGVGVEWI
jgi:hypothetical protein